MGFTSFLPEIISISSIVLNGIFAYRVMRNRTRSGKSTDTNAKADGTPHVPLEKVIDAVVQSPIRYRRAKAEMQQSEVELANYRLDSLLKRACKYVDNLFPNADPQARAEHIKRILLVLARELGIKNVQELEQALLIKPNVPDQTAEKNKISE